MLCNTGRTVVTYSKSFMLVTSMRYATSNQSFQNKLFEVFCRSEGKKEPLAIAFKDSKSRCWEFIRVACISSEVTVWTIEDPGRQERGQEGSSILYACRMFDQTLRDMKLAKGRRGNGTGSNGSPARSYP